MNIHLHLVMTTILLLSVISFVLNGLFNVNLINYLSFQNKNVKSVLYVTIGFIVLYFLFNRDFYLPFLGQTVLPPSLIKDIDVDSYDKEIKLCNIPTDVVKVIYWAADPSNNITIFKNYKKAYNKFSNVGTTIVYNNCATLRLKMPQPYTVPRFGVFGEKTLSRHVHYRYVYPSGFISPVMTYYIM